MITDKHPAVIIQFAGWKCHFEDREHPGMFGARLTYRNNTHYFTWYNRRGYNAVTARRLLKAIKKDL